jgi:hypothetical protein
VESADLFIRGSRDWAQGFTPRGGVGPVSAAYHYVERINKNLNQMGKIAKQTKESKQKTKLEIELNVPCSN